MSGRDVLALVLSALMTTAGLAWIKLLAPDALGLAWPALLRLGVAAGVYFSGMGVWLWVLGRNEMSVAYPVGIALSLLTSTSAGFLLLGEPPTLSRLLGIAAVMAGVALVAGRRV